jgi:hypothetical protein
MQQIALANLIVVSAVILIRSMRGMARRLHQSNGASTFAAENHVFDQRRAEWSRGWDRNHDYLWRGHLCRFTDGRSIIFEAGFTQRITIRTPGTELTRADLAKSVFNLGNAYRKITIYFS